MGHEFVLPARSKARAVAVGKFAARYAGFVTGDLSSADEVKQIADRVNAIGRMDAVIHNAEVYTRRGQGTTTEGRATTFAINTLAPFMLTALIERPARSPCVSSQRPPPRPGRFSDDLDWTKQA